MGSRISSTTAPRINADGVQNIADFQRFVACFNQPASCDPSADCGPDGIIAIRDFLRFQPQFNVANGPSGLIQALKTTGVETNGVPGATPKNCP
jgi:hypothetical protein